MINPSEELSWHRSTRCASGTCVEVAQQGDQFLIRDSKNPHVAPIAFTREEWASFLTGVREGEFDFG